MRIAVSREGDGAFAVVDVDTLWRHRDSGEASHWLGRACKGYTRVGRTVEAHLPHRSSRAGPSLAIQQGPQPLVLAPRELQR